MYALCARSVVLAAVLLLAGCRYTVEPGAVERKHVGGIDTVNGSFKLRLDIFGGNASQRGGGCLNYADLSKPCSQDIDCQTPNPQDASKMLPGNCAAYTNSGTPKVCWVQAAGAGACQKQPTQPPGLTPNQPYLISRPNDVVQTQPTYWRVITCQPFADFSCHQYKPDGTPNFRLRYGPVKKFNPRGLPPPLNT